jgi:DNA-binding beta-propeller fold protein YncE
MNKQATRREFLQMASALLAMDAMAATGGAAPGQIKTLCGAGVRGLAADGDDAMAAKLNNPYGMAEKADHGSLYFVDNGSNRILRLDRAANKIRLVAGTGKKGYGGDGGPATEAVMAQPHEAHFDSKGNLYVVERDNYTVRRIDAKTGFINVFAGTPTVNGLAGDNGPATKAIFNQPHGLAIDPHDNVYICDVLNHRVRRVDAKTGIITTFAGTGKKGHAPDEGALLEVPLDGPRSLEISRQGRIYVALREGNGVFELDGKRGKAKRIAGTGENGYTGDGGPAVKATFGSLGPDGLTGPKGLAVTEDGRTMFVADCENHCIRRVDLKTGIITTAAGTGKKGDGPEGDPLKCAMNRPHAVYVRGGVVYIGDSENHKIRTIGV